MDKVAPWLLLGGVVYVIIDRVSKISGIDTAIERDKEKNKAANQIPINSVDIGGRCIDNNNCKGGGNTSICQNSTCIPLVAEDIIGRPRFAANEIGLKRYCGEYVLGGVCAKCASNKQCSADGIAISASDPSATFSSAGSKYQCINGKCSPTILAGTNLAYHRERASETLKFLDKKGKMCDDAKSDYLSTKDCTSVLFRM